MNIFENNKIDNSSKLMGSFKLSEIIINEIGSTYYLIDENIYILCDESGNNLTWRSDV